MPPVPINIGVRMGVAPASAATTMTVGAPARGPATQPPIAAAHPVVIAHPALRQGQIVGANDEYRIEPSTALGGPSNSIIVLDSLDKQCRTAVRRSGEKTVEQGIADGVRFTEEVLGAMRSQILSALEYIHKRGGGHGNVHPHNITMTENGSGGWFFGLIYSGHNEEPAPEYLTSGYSLDRNMFRMDEQGLGLTLLDMARGRVRDQLISRFDHPSDHLAMLRRNNRYLSPSFLQILETMIGLTKEEFRPTIKIYHTGRITLAVAIVVAALAAGGIMVFHSAAQAEADHAQLERRRQLGELLAGEMSPEIKSGLLQSAIQTGRVRTPEDFLAIFPNGKEMTLSDEKLIGDFVGVFQSLGPTKIQISDLYSRVADPQTRETLNVMLEEAK